MGDETTEFASRFSGAVTFLRELAGRGAQPVPAAPRRGDLAARLRGALDAVEAV